METPDELKVLVEIRDIQREHLQEYRNVTQRLVHLQELAVRRQALIQKAIFVFVVIAVIAIAYLLILVRQTVRHEVGWNDYGPSKISQRPTFGRLR